MERGDIIEAQTMTSSQLQAVRNKIVVDRMTLRKAVLNLYPNFNVDDSANMQQLETNLIAAYPEVAPALKVANLDKTIKNRGNQLDSLRLQNNLPDDVLQITVDWTKVPSSATLASELKNKAGQILDFIIDTERLRRARSKQEKLLP